MNKVIIGFHGRAGSGKDTSADGLNKKFLRLAFAKPLKDAAQILFNFTDEQLYDTKLKEVVDDTWGKSPRQLLQWLGTDAIRNNVSEDFFLIHMKQIIEKQSDIFNMFAIVDVRFSNEAQLIRDMGGIVIEIIREDKSTGGTEHTSHTTEQSLPRGCVDYTIENNGTIEELHSKVNEIINNHFFEFNEEKKIELIMTQCKISKKVAIEKLEKFNGDFVNAIIDFKV